MHQYEHVKPRSRRSLMLMSAALLFWLIGMPLAFFADGAWRAVGIALWVPCAITVWVLLAHQIRRQDDPTDRRQ